MIRPRINRRVWAWARLLGGAAILAVIIWRLGTGPFVDGLRRVSVWSLVAAAAITVLTTFASAWRWCVVARGLGVELGFGAAVAAYYRSQFLNTALPGGVLGDVHRAVEHGRSVGDVGRGVRAVIWERCAGQVVQIAIAAVVLLALPWPGRSAMPMIVLVALVALVACLAAAVAVRAASPGGQARWVRMMRIARSDVRDVVLARRAWPAITAASCVVVAGHTATFLIAANTAGVEASTLRVLPLAMLVLLAMAVPLNIGGWGPREGVAAWAFATAGLGADAGVATATVYGVLVVAAGLPGLGVLVGTDAPAGRGSSKRRASRVPNGEHRGRRQP